MNGPPQDFTPGGEGHVLEDTETCSNKPQKLLSSANLLCSHLLSAHCHSQAPLLCSVFINISKREQHSPIPPSEASFLCLSVSFLPRNPAFGEGRPCGERSLTLALSGEPVGLLPAVHRDQRVDALRVLDNFSTKSQTSFIREPDSSLISVR